MTVAGIGHNQGPSLTFEAISTHISDLYEEARGWLDGEPISTQGQADAVGKLLGMLREAERAADDARKAENAPFDAGKAEVQARYAPLISDTKTVTGKTVLALRACQKALTPWLIRLDQEREAKAKAAAEEAAKLAQAAKEAAAAAVSLDDVEDAEAMFIDAKAATKAAEHVATDRARAGVGTGFKATVLWDNWVPVMTDPQAALRYYWAERRADLEAVALRFAQEDVRAGKRSLPGFDIQNQRKAV